MDHYMLRHEYVEKIATMIEQKLGRKKREEVETTTTEWKKRRN